MRPNNILVINIVDVGIHGYTNGKHSVWQKCFLISAGINLELIIQFEFPVRAF